MRIACPFCGPRGSEEYTYLGDATVRRPEGDAPSEAWFAYVYLRDNPAGRHRELWYHGAGCRSWLVVERDMRSHDILSVAPARDMALARGRAA
ncbi:sarcosine oxidase subunit delta [Roseicella aquatilis]|uniref:Sarcosine oxidase subunit delta n=1 Tax=Roseicella aquatilis TaxID=2527868 RepID=A0A4R4DTC6_9PROT|nr:sarcosine oxidase subunit delta [Roseicella aquatilis]TCZ64863.1 sarcosine oxidase subunit delta [Roseicella aquatilis]